MAAAPDSGPAFSVQSSEGRGPGRKIPSWPVLLVLLLFAGFFAWQGARLYIQRRDRMIVAAASHAMDVRDFPSAWVWLQRLYHAHPDDIETNRLAARFAAMQRSPEELGWRLRVIQIGPATRQDYLDWASAALRLGQTSLALDALNHMPSQWQQDAAYHDLLGIVLLSAGQVQGAADHFGEAARIEPSNPIHLVNLSSIQLTSTNAAIRDAARVTLEQLATGSAPLPANRALLNDAIRQHDTAGMTRFRAAMLTQSDRSLSDQLTCISTAPSRKEMRDGLLALWKAVEPDPAGALQVSEWMMGEGDSAEALDWLRKLSPDVQSTVAVQTAQADALTALHDWPGLRTYLTGKNWVACDFLRVALLVRSARKTGDPAPVFADAVASCHGDGSDLLLLAQAAGSWSWQSDAEALYWKISLMGYPGRGPALKALWDLYTAAGDSANLLRVASEQHADSPADLSVSNNFAFLSLLTGIGSTDAARIAAGNYQKQPGDPNLAATYAYSLYLDGHYQEGLHVLTPFGQPRMQAAGAALYLALLQQAAGQQDAASRTAAAVDPSHLLPEERLLLQKISAAPHSGLDVIHGNYGLAPIEYNPA